MDQHDAMECKDALRAKYSAAEFDGEPPADFMYMPGGQHTVWLSRGGKPAQVTVNVTPETAVVLQAKFAALQAARAPQRPYFDFEHKAEDASAWPVAFAWRNSPEPGVYVNVEWSLAGKNAVVGKVQRAFSPVFFADAEFPKVPLTAKEVTIPDGKRGSASNPASVIGLDFCAGSLTNEPAFRKILPLWAKEAKATETTETHNQLPQIAAEGADSMTPEEIAALQAKAAEQEKELLALKAKEVTSAIDRAIERGAIEPKNEALKAKYVKIGDIELIDALPANESLKARVTKPETKSVEIPLGQLAPLDDACKGYAAEKDPKRRGALYAREFSPRVHRDEMIPLHAVNSLGTVAADLVTQRRLELLVDTLPILTRIARTYSDQALKFGKTAYAQKIGIPTVTDYVAATGWADSGATTTDITVTLNKRRGIQIAFDQEELSGTTRRLFTEQEDAQVYALGKDITDALYALITAGNFASVLTAIALADFKRASIPAFANELDTNKVPDFMRSFILTNSFYNKLQEDGSIVSIALPESQAAMQTGKLPMLSNMLPIKATNLPSTGKLAGLAMFPDALGMVTSPDEDYLSAIPGVPSTALLQNITEPRTGITATLVKFHDHKLAKAYQRASLVYGVAKGDGVCGVRLIST